MQHRVIITQVLEREYLINADSQEAAMEIGNFILKHDPTIPREYKLIEATVTAEKNDNVVPLPVLELPIRS